MVITLYPLYTVYAEYYDFIYKGYLEKTVPRLIDFVVEVFKRDAEVEVRDILDIACGTGGPTIELARRGYNVTGLDVSEKMIQIAAQKAERSGVKIRFIVGDMRNLNFMEEFDAVTCFFTSINYVLENGDMEKVFLGVFRSLRKGGIFIADIPNPYLMERWIKGIPTIWRVDDEDMNILIVDSAIMDTISGIVDWKRTLIVNKKDSVEFVPDYHRIRVYTPNELKIYATHSGFRRTKLYGDLKIADRPPRDAKRIFFIAIK